MKLNCCDWKCKTLKPYKFSSTITLCQFILYGELKKKKVFKKFKNIYSLHRISTKLKRTENSKKNLDAVKKSDSSSTCYHLKLLLSCFHLKTCFFQTLNFLHGAVSFLWPINILLYFKLKPCKKSCLKFNVWALFIYCHEC